MQQIEGAPMKSERTFNRPFFHEPLDLDWLKDNYVKVHSILFRFMYGFMGVRPIEMIKIAFRKKWTQAQKN